MLTVFPSNHFGRGLALGRAFADGTALSGFRINTHPGTGAGMPWNWGLTAAHDTHQNSGMPRHGLLEEGVLVYTVDSRVDNGQLPIKLAGDSGDGRVDGFPMLQVGESVTVRGFTITVSADGGNTHTVKIERDR